MKIARTCAALLVTAVAATTLAAPTAAEAAAHHRAGAYKPTLTASTHTVMADKKVVLSGKVKPATKGGKVIIEKRVNGKEWKEETRTTMSKSGKFSYTDKPDTAGVRQYRAVVPKHKKHKLGTSKPVSVTVMRWQYLTQVTSRVRDSVSGAASVQIDSVSYGHAFVGNRYREAGSIDWNLDRLCTTLKGRFGESDDSDADATSHIQVEADGASLYSKDFALTQSESRTIDISGVFRLAFTWTGSSPSADPETGLVGAVPAFVETQVLCAF